MLGGGGRVQNMLGGHECSWGGGGAHLIAVDYKPLSVFSGLQASWLTSLVAYKPSVSTP